VGAPRLLGVGLALLSGLIALPVCGITGLAAADHYLEAGWPIALTITYYAVGAAWLTLVLTTVSGRPLFIVASFLTVLALLVGLVTFYLARLT
jgi:hypothetical protein